MIIREFNIEDMDEATGRKELMMEWKNNYFTRKVYENFILHFCNLHVM